MLQITSQRATEAGAVLKEAGLLFRPFDPDSLTAICPTIIATIKEKIEKQREALDIAIQCVSDARYEDTGLARVLNGEYLGNIFRIVVRASNYREAQEKIQAVLNPLCVDFPHKGRWDELNVPELIATGYPQLDGSVSFDGTARQAHQHVLVLT